MAGFDDLGAADQKLAMVPDENGPTQPVLDGVAELVDRCCRLARRFAEALAAAGAEIVNDVVLNQVLVSFGDDARNDAIVAGVQREGTCWLGGTTWRGRRLIRISVSNYSTTERDVDISVAAILRVAAGV